MRNKLVSGLVVVSLFSVLAVPCLAWADSSLASPVAITNTQALGVEANVSQNQALEIARKAFNISEAQQNIQTSYVNDDYFGKKYWQFSWNIPQLDGYRGIMVSVDSLTGTILDYNDYSDVRLSQSSSQAKSEKDCEKIAETLAKTLVPDKFAQCKSKKPPFPNSYISGPQIYNFSWERQVNGIPFGENAITLSVNAETGKVCGYHLVWDDKAVFPNPAQAISIEQAQDIFRKKIGLRLNYNRRINPFSPQPNISKQPVDLYYSVGDGFNNSPTIIDALTGKLVDPTGKETSVAEQVYLKALPELPVATSVTPLSLQEAQAKLLEYVQIPQGFIIQSSQQTENWGYGGDKSWQFQLQNPNSPQDPGYSVNINAITGELINLNRFTTGPEVPESKEPKLDYNRCKQIATAFVAKACGAKADYLILQESPNRTPNIMYYNNQAIVQPSYTFTFTRVVNGIPFSGNQVYLEVNNQTGEINNYYLNWERSANFSSPVDLITPQQAVDLALTSGQTHLAYYRKQSTDGRASGNIGLTYLFFDDQLSLVEAKTGKLVSYWVEENPVKLSDIAGHQAEKEIRYLCTLGILDGGANKFNPDKGLTRAELVKMLVAAKGLEPDSSTPPRFSDVPKSAWYYGWVQTAAKAGLIKGSASRFNPDQMVTSQEMVVMMIRALKTPYSDLSRNLLDESYLDGDKIAPWAKDAYTMAAQMGILTSKKGYLNPVRGATRGEAAIMLQRTIERASRYGLGFNSNP